MPRLDLTGKRFGRLVVNKLAYVKDYRTYWECNCDCGKENVIIKGKYLSNGDTKSCGCLNLERISDMGKQNKNPNDFYITDDVVHVKFHNSEEEFLCDIEDWDKLCCHTWFLNNNGYARTSIDDKFVLFHTLVLQHEDNFEIDHISGDILDNRKQNLRVVSRKDNMKNKAKYKNNTSGCKGVSFHKGIGKWIAYIGLDNKNHSLGAFNYIDDAINARKDAEIKLFGEYNRSEQ